jgi:hypothetical protein
MQYHCLCEDGPAQGYEFWGYGPPVRMDVPHEGQILEYRLHSRQENRYIYHYHTSNTDGHTYDIVE